MKVKLDPGAKMPEKAHDTDGGFDLFTPEIAVVYARSSAVIDTGVHIQLPPGTAGLLVSKSGLNVKHNLTSTGLIDQGYSGSIRVKLYNHGNEDYTIEAGDKISQLVVLKIMDVSLQEVSELDESERGENGFGSSGR